MNQDIDFADLRRIPNEPTDDEHRASLAALSIGAASRVLTIEQALTLLDDFASEARQRQAEAIERNRRHCALDFYYDGQAFGYEQAARLIREHVVPA